MAQDPLWLVYHSALQNPSFLVGQAECAVHWVGEQDDLFKNTEARRARLHALVATCLLQRKAAAWHRTAKMVVLQQAAAVPGLPPLPRQLHGASYRQSSFQQGTTSDYHFRTLPAEGDPPEGHPAEGQQAQRGLVGRSSGATFGGIFDIDDGQV